MMKHFRGLAALLLVSGAYGARPPGPWTSFLLGRLESSMYRHVTAGRFRLALKDRLAMLKKQGIACESDNACKLLSALSRHPDLLAGARPLSTIAAERRRGHLFLPVTVNGVSAHYIFDTGAGYSVITESEAARLALPVANVNAGSIGDVSGNGFPVTKIAYAATLKLDGIELKNVQFLVASDESKLWGDLPPGWRGALGIQVLRACEMVHWDSAGEVQLGRRQRPPGGVASALQFGGTGLFAESEFANRKLSLLLDTGATSTCLYAPFASSFPALVKEFGKPGKARFTGAGGDAELETTVMPEVVLPLGGFRVSLRDVHIHPPGPNASRRHGAIGLDVLNQAREVTIDFRSMKVMLR